MPISDRKDTLSEDDEEGDLVLQKLMEKNNKLINEDSKGQLDSFAKFSDFKDLNLNVVTIDNKEAKVNKAHIVIKEEKMTVNTVMDSNSLFNSDFISFFSQNSSSNNKNSNETETPKVNQDNLKSNNNTPQNNLIIQNHDFEIRKENNFEKPIPINNHEHLIPIIKTPPVSNPNNPYQQYFYVNPNPPKQHNDMIPQSNNIPQQQEFFNKPMKDSFDPTMFLENPSSIIQKNLVQRGWFLMSENNKILGNFNSLDLLIYLDEEFEAEADMSKVWITDYETDIYFTPSNLYEALKDTVPKLMENIKPKKPQQNMPFGIPPQQGYPPMNKMPYNPYMMPMNPKMTKGMPVGMPGNNSHGNGPYPNAMPPMDRNMMMRNPIDDRMLNRPPMNNQHFQMHGPMMNAGHKSMSNQNMPHVNMNINLQFVKNDINLNNITYQQKEPSKMQKKPSNLTNLFNSASKEEATKTSNKSKK
jgi:hypothetical protein